MTRQIVFKTTFLSILTFVFSCGIQEEPTRQTQELQEQANGSERLIIVDGNSQSATVTSKLSDLVVAAIDPVGNPLIGSKVEFHIESGPVRLGATEVQTDLDGKTNVSAEFTTVAGPAKVKARLLPDPNNDENRTVYFDLTATRDNPSQFIVVAASTCSRVDREDTWSVKLADKYGNGVSGFFVDVIPDTLMVNGKALGEAAKLPVNSSGVVTFNVTAPSYQSDGSITLSSAAAAVSDLKVSVNVWPMLRFELLDPSINPYDVLTDNDDIYFPTVRLMYDGCTLVPNQDIQCRLRYGGGASSTCSLTGPFKTDADGKYRPTYSQSANVNYTPYHYDFDASYLGATAPQFQFVMNIQP